MGKSKEEVIMPQRLLSWGITLVWLVLPALALAAKTTYIYTDRKYHFVKRVELKKKELKARGEADHPHTFDALALRELLAGIEVSKQLVLAKKVEEREVFNKHGLDFLVPHLVEAFAQAQPDEQIVFSVILRKPRVVFQDTHLTLAEAWIQEGFLHLHFRKLMAKIDLTKNDKFADVSRAINRARGLRVSLELKEGQQFGESTEEILLPLAGLPKVEVKEKEEELAASPVEEKPEVKEPAKPKATAEQEPPSEIEARLRELEDLKNKKLITKKEYETKKKEILKDL